MRIGLLSAWMAGCLAVAGARGADWPQWGGSHGNNVSAEKSLPDSFTPVKSAREITPAANVRWVAPLGGACYGNPTISGGRVFVGTDDKSLSDDPRFIRTGAGLVKCFDEKTGQLLWQLVVPKRTADKRFLYGHQQLGTCSSPLVEGDRAYVVTSAMEVVCLDVKGQADGNEGPFTDEASYVAGAGNNPVKLSNVDADIVWRFDLIKDLGACPHDAASCSILVHGDLLYLSTSNGVDQPHAAMLNPDAPSLIALDKRTGRLAAYENEGICRRTWHCTWSPPSKGVVDGRTLIFHGGADGWCYAFEALATAPQKPVALKRVWSFDCNPPEYRLRDGKPIEYYSGDKRKRNSPNKNDGAFVGPSEVIGTPVFHEGRVYVAIGQDPAHGRGRGLLHCIDASKTGDITQAGRIWSYDGLDRTIATPTVADGLVYVPDVAGRIHCVDANTGKAVWVQEMKAEAWGSILVADGKLYAGNQRDLWILAAGREPKVLSRISLGAPLYTTPVVANGAVYIASQRNLWAVGK